MFWSKKLSAGLSAVMLAMLILPAGSATAATTTATVNWGSSTGKSVSPYAYGINIYKGFEGSAVAANTTYKANVSAMKPGMVRYHRAQQMKESRSGYSGYDAGGWVMNPGSSSYAWDVNKIKGILSQNFTNNPVKMMNIANWPSYMSDSTGKLKTNMYDAYAQFCAQLVKIVNIDNGYNVKYWEVTNELDGVYGTDFSQVAAIYNKAADAMKAVDSTIKVGGPAFESAGNTARIDSFVSNAHAKLDFVSYHTYFSGSGSSYKSNQQVFDSARSIAWATSNVRNSINKYTTKAIELFHNEYNISWAPPDTRMNNEIGMVFDALAATNIAKAGARGGAAWNEADGWYGKLDGSYNRRPSSYLFELLNTDGFGEIMSTSVSDGTKIDIMALKSGTYKKILLINRSEADITTQLSFSGWTTTPSSGTTFTVKRVGATGGISYPGNISYGTLTSTTGISLPKNTVTMLVINNY